MAGGPTPQIHVDFPGFIQSNNNEGTISKFACREVWNLYREVIPLTVTHIDSIPEN